MLKNNLGDDLSRRTYCAQSIPGIGETIVNNERVPYYRHVKKWTTYEPWTFSCKDFIKALFTKSLPCNKKTWSEIGLGYAKKDNNKKYGLNLGCNSKIYFPLDGYDELQLDKSHYSNCPHEINRVKQFFKTWSGKEAQQKKNMFLQWGKEKNLIKNQSVNSILLDDSREYIITYQ